MREDSVLGAVEADLNRSLAEWGYGDWSAFLMPVQVDGVVDLLLERITGRSHAHVVSLTLADVLDYRTSAPSKQRVLAMLRDAAVKLLP